MLLSLLLLAVRPGLWLVIFGAALLSLFLVRLLAGPFRRRYSNKVRPLPFLLTIYIFLVLVLAMLAATLLLPAR